MGSWKLAVEVQGEGHADCGAWHEGGIGLVDVVGGDYGDGIEGKGIGTIPICIHAFRPYPIA